MENEEESRAVFNASSCLVLHVCDLLARLVRDEVLAGKVVGGVLALPPHLQPGLHEGESMLRSRRKWDFRRWFGRLPGLISRNFA